MGIVKAVDVIHAQAGYLSFPCQPEDQIVGGVEDPWVLDPEADQFADREEAPVVDLLVGQPPEGQPVVLLGEDAVEVVEAAGIALPPVMVPQGFVDILPDLVAFRVQTQEPRLDPLFGRVPLPGRLVVAPGAFGRCSMS